MQGHLAAENLEVDAAGVFRIDIAARGEQRFVQPLSGPGSQVTALSDVQHHWRAGFAAWQRGMPHEAGGHFHEAARIAPQDPAGQQALAEWCLSTGDLAGALRYSEKAMSMSPRDPDVLIARAAAVAYGQNALEAWQIIRPLLDAPKCPPRAALLYGKLAPQLGQEHDALNRMLQLLRSPTHSPADRSLLHFGAATLLDRLGQYDEAFGHATAAHDACRRPYDPGLIPRLVDRRLAYYTPNKVHGLPHATHGSRRPIFIIGMPRSGTTLIEQILSSHPDVYGAGEVAELPELVRAAVTADARGGHDYPLCLDALSLRNCNELAARYLAALGRLNSTARYVTDKMLPNYLFLGTIAMLFPDAHVIHCLRDPLDTCLSCYMTDFAAGHEFAQDLRHVGAYYGQYRRLMSHWRDTLRFPMIEIQYEKVVANFDGEVRGLLEKLDLPWDARCLEFHRNARHAPTASVQQVRKPLYAGSVDRWRNYAVHVRPLAEALGQ